MHQRVLLACLMAASLWIGGCGGGGDGPQSVTEFDPNNRDRAAFWWAGRVQELVDAKLSGNQMRVDEALQKIEAARAPLAGQRIQFVLNVWTSNPDLPSTVWNYSPISADGVWVGLLHRADPGRIRVGVQYPGRQGARAIQLKPVQHIDPAILRELGERSTFEVSGTIAKTNVDRLDSWHMGMKTFSTPPTLELFLTDIRVEKVNP